MSAREKKLLGILFSGIAALGVINGAVMVPIIGYYSERAVRKVLYEHRSMDSHQMYVKKREIDLRVKKNDERLERILQEIRDIKENLDRR